MKSLIKKLATSVGVASIYANQAFAQSGNALFERGVAPNAVSQQDLPTSITTIINYFLGLLGLIAVAFLIYAGVLMVTAGGNDEQVTKARKIITYAAVGIVIILLSYTIVSFVSQALG